MLNRCTADGRRALTRGVTLVVSLVCLSLSVMTSPYAYAAPGPCSEQRYWLASADGGVFTFGCAPYLGSMASTHLAAPVVAMTSDDQDGYRMVASDGGVFTFGIDQFFGSMAGTKLTAPISGMASVGKGSAGGYWLVGTDGAVYAFGAAKYLGRTVYGSTCGSSCSREGSPIAVAPIVGIASTSDGRGYWLTSADGGVYTFGDAIFYGSMSGHPLAAPVRGIAATQDGTGYWLLGQDGGVFAFGDAAFYGAATSQSQQHSFVAMAVAPQVHPCSSPPYSGPTQGYWITDPRGDALSFGDAEQDGSASSLTLAAPMVAIASPPEQVNCGIPSV